MQTARQGTFFLIQAVSYVIDSNVIIKSLLLSRTFLFCIDWRRTQSTRGLNRMEMEREQRDREDNRLYSVITGAVDLSHDSGKDLQDGVLWNWKCENDSGSSVEKTPSYPHTHTLIPSHTHTHTRKLNFIKRICVSVSQTRLQHMLMAAQGWAVQLLRAIHSRSSVIIIIESLCQSCIPSFTGCTPIKKPKYQHHTYNPDTNSSLLPWEFFL